MLDSNQRPLGYEPNELPTAPIRDTKLQIFHLKQNFKKWSKRGIEPRNTARQVSPCCLGYRENTPMPLPRFRVSYPTPINRFQYVRYLRLTIGRLIPTVKINLSSHKLTT